MEEVDRLKRALMGEIVEHLARSGGAIATPGNEVARVRRDILRGLRGAR